MPPNHRKSTLSRESSTSSSQSSRSSENRKRSRKMSRNSRSHRYHARDGDVEEEVAGVGKRVYKTVEKLENPVKKLGKLVLWSAPLILAGLEVRHEWHHHIHKRRMMEKEYEKAHLEIQLQMEKNGNKEGITVGGTKSHEPTQEKEKASAPAPISEEVHILPFPVQVDRRDEYPRRHLSRRELEERDPYLLPPLAPDVPCHDVWEIRQPRIRVKQPGSREVRFPQVRSRSESVYEYRRW
ncbi:hypothetical protein BOTNAR_0215g00130 [Botryotinia narcissicola]|uniref:Uncharacterized protein n=1 Tax=Botryotinia narcissicola TaxID=278944 RepID=A0A4Z1I5I4_9HELO|nr:hypothetical protein BOTNAR_0215g00130 [Botryotinia narcissicola]